MSLVSDIILQAFVDIGTITPGETITTAMQTDAFTRSNQLLGSLSTEGAMAFNQVMQQFNLLPGAAIYTLGSGGTFNTTGGLRAQRVTIWRATFSDMVKGGPVLSLAEFASAAALEQKALAELNTQALLTGQIASFPSPIGAPIPSVVGADTAYPLINVRIFPAPLVQAGVIELGYWTPFAAFATVGDTVNFPPGYEEMFHWNLGLEIFPQFGRPSMKDVVVAMAQKTKASIIQQNTMGSASPAPAQQ
jgi:hypothetical protein